MEHDEQKHEYLRRLAEELAKHGFAIELRLGSRQSFLKVANPGTPQLNERVFCHQAEDGSWCYWWPWRQPIGSVEDLETVIGRIAAVLRSVEGRS